MSSALGVKPARAVGTQKQYCSAFYIASPCREETVNIYPVKPLFLHSL
jgi:hypothetical protein